MKNTVTGTLFLTKVDGNFFVAFVVPEEHENERSYSLSDEKTVAIMLYKHGVIDEQSLFNLVGEGNERVIPGEFQATLLFAILLGLAEVPEKVEDISIDLESFLDPPGTRKLAN